jgi:hypothetical protein
MSAGKGDARRPESVTGAYGSNYDRIFGGSQKIATVGTQEVQSPQPTSDGTEGTEGTGGSGR